MTARLARMLKTGLRPLLAAALLAAALAAVGAGTSSGDATPSLPNLHQLVPGNVSVVVTKGPRPRERLIFSSTVVNLGPGPFVIEARRPSRRVALMTAHQVLVGPGTARTRVRNVGRLRYVRSEDHEHWHLAKLESFELRRPDTGALVTPDRKTGFCPGDRYVYQRGLPRGWNRRAYGLRNDNNCGLGKSRALTMLESISPGWADVYEANVDGQFIDVTGVPAGRYVLVNRANPQRRLRETTFDDNVSSAYIELARPPGGKPTVRTLNYCRDSATCP